MKRLSLMLVSLFCVNVFAVEPLFVRGAVGMKSYPAAPRLALRAAMVPATVLPPAETTVPEKIEALREWNRGGREPAHVGFMRQLPDAIDLRLAGPVAAKTAAPFGRGVVALSDHGTILWSTMVKVEGAQRIRLHLENVHLPEGTVLWVYGTSGGETGCGSELIDSRGNVWTPSVDGEVVYLDVEAPVSSLGATPLSFAIREVAQIFGAQAAALQPQDTPSCLVDSTCVASATFPSIASARAAVAHIEWPESSTTIGLCSGGLLNNRNSDGTPYFLTANHCFSDQNTATSAEFFFDFQTASCNGSYNLQTAPHVNGAQLLATSTSSDFTFLKLSGIPAGRFLLGWDPNPVQAGATLYRISHPVPSDTIFPQMFSSTTVDPSSGTCTGRDRPDYVYSDYLQGGTYPGSSGSPAILAGGYVVGQLLGACGATPEAGCDASNYIVDGAFSNTYGFIQQWLSPGSGSQPLPCVPDANTACLLNGRFKATVRYRNAFDNNPVDTAALVKPVTGFGSANYETAFFYFNSANNIELLLKMLDQGNTDAQGHPTIAVLYGTATPLRIEVTLTDTTNGTVKQFTSAFGSMTGQTDFTAFVK